VVDAVTPVLVIGGGLSGLLSAVLLKDAGIECHLIESRARWGGRIRTAGGIDLGPSWFWPGQSRIEALISRLALSDAVFDQHATGLAVGERADGAVAKQSGLASMQGSLRLRGGLETLVSALRAELDYDAIHLGHRATAIHRRDAGLVVDVDINDTETDAEADANTGASANTSATASASASAGAGTDASATVIATTRRFLAKRVVLALPPRLVSTGIAFSPALTDETMTELGNVPTWMAAQAKFAAVYGEPFWRDAGLSGDAVSQRGPLVEIHDASAASGQPYALSGFLGVPAQARHRQTDALIDAAIHQLSRLFGAKAEQPLATHLADWAFEPYTTSAIDREAAAVHPPGGAPDLGVWNEQIVWAGSETAAPGGHAAGYLEGAVQAAERAAGKVIDKLGR